MKVFSEMQCGGDQVSFDTAVSSKTMEQDIGPSHASAMGEIRIGLFIDSVMWTIFDVAGSDSLLEAIFHSLQLLYAKVRLNVFHRLC